MRNMLLRCFISIQSDFSDKGLSNSWYPLKLLPEYKCNFVFRYCLLFPWVLTRELLATEPSLQPPEAHITTDILQGVEMNSKKKHGGLAMLCSSTRLCRADLPGLQITQAVVQLFRGRRLKLYWRIWSCNETGELQGRWFPHVSQAWSEKAFTLFGWIMRVVEGHVLLGGQDRRANGKCKWEGLLDCQGGGGLQSGQVWDDASAPQFVCCLKHWWHISIICRAAFLYLAFILYAHLWQNKASSDNADVFAKHSLILLSRLAHTNQPLKEPSYGVLSEYLVGHHWCKYLKSHLSFKLSVLVPFVVVGEETQRICILFFLCSVCLHSHSWQCHFSSWNSRCRN